MTDSYVYVITALLPLAAAMLIFQTNPYHALVIRGILGAIAALVYTVLGAADVALTEALVGTLLAITLYAVAVRSSLVLRLGVLKAAIATADELTLHPDQFQPLINELRTIFSKHYMRIELVPYPNPENLYQALLEREVHATCVPSEFSEQTAAVEIQSQPYHTTTRLPRLYEILKTELKSPLTYLTLVHAPDSKEKNQ